MFYWNNPLHLRDVDEHGWPLFSVAQRSKESLNCLENEIVRGAMGQKEDWRRSLKDKNPGCRVLACLNTGRLGTFRSRQAETNIEEECFDGYPANSQWP